MKIKILSFGTLGTVIGRQAEDLVARIENAFHPGRFVVNRLDHRYCRLSKRNPYLAEVSFGLVRLEASKLYCGNHPSACELGNKQDKKASHLEGADWVEFDDRLNDLLDAAEVSANVGDSVVIRKGRERCIEYFNGDYPEPGRNYQWAKEGRYADYIGSIAPRALFPAGTPGRHEQTGYAVIG